MEVEKKVKAHTKRARIQDALILALYGTTMLSVAVLAPNALKLLKGIDPDMSKKRKPAYRIQQALKRLESRGLIYKGKEEKLADRLHTVEKIIIRKPRRWDGKWRVVIFDIWERRKGTRERLRSILKKAGFFMLQDSVWIHQYPCEELIAFVRSDLKLGSGILYLIAEGIEHENKLCKHF